MLKAGDIVIYVYPKLPEGHGSLGIISKIDPTIYPDFPVYVDFLFLTPYMRALADLHSGWKVACWEKIGELSEPTA